MLPNYIMQMTREKCGLLANTPHIELLWSFIKGPLYSLWSFFKRFKYTEWITGNMYGVFFSLSMIKNVGGNNSNKSCENFTQQECSLKEACVRECVGREGEGWILERMYPKLYLKPFLKLLTNFFLKLYIITLAAMKISPLKPKFPTRS